MNELAGRWEMRDHFIDDTDGRKGGKGISIHISSDPAKDGSEREKVYFLEAGIRAGRLMGCQISGEDGSPVDGASCRFERGEFFVEVASKSGSKIVHKLSGRRDGLIVGDCFMVNRIIPTGQVKIADVTLRKLN
ncbi:MAG: hypothetical protein JO224_06860 [Pelomonas sp.]|nr:hypothetical protein [Roseateles sp.]MBV8604387.1 hypothetical protein [Roseateles sp.]